MSTEPTTEMMNEVICEFMGGHRMISGTIHVYKGPDEIEWETGKYLKYHTSWDWLMPVVEKIEGMGNSVRIYTGHTTICTNTGHPVCQIVEGSKISATYKAVYKFITWYNQQKQTNEQ